MKEALKDDLRKLRAQLATLHLRTKTLQYSAARHRVVRPGHEFKRRLENTLKSSESQGELNALELETLQHEADDVLMGFVQILASNPSQTNISAALKDYPKKIEGRARNDGKNHQLRWH